MFEQEIEHSAEAALTETLGNMFYLINAWAEVDLKRQDGVLTFEQEVAQFSDIVRVLGTSLYDSLIGNPVMLVTTLTASEGAALKMEKILSQHKEKN